MRLRELDSKLKLTGVVPDSSEVSSMKLNGQGQLGQKLLDWLSKFFSHKNKPRNSLELNMRRKRLPDGTQEDDLSVKITADDPKVALELQRKTFDHLHRRNGQNTDDHGYAQGDTSLSLPAVDRPVLAELGSADNATD